MRPHMERLKIDSASGLFLRMMEEANVAVSMLSDINSELNVDTPVLLESFSTICFSRQHPVYCVHLLLNSLFPRLLSALCSCLRQHPLFSALLESLLPECLSQILMVSQ